MSNLPPEFEIFITGDGSPTLCFKNSENYVEKMHHSGGALSETLYIYGQAIELAFKNTTSPRVLSLGLGLAYNEALVAAHALKNAIPSSQVQMWSFENHPELYQAALDWMVARSGELQTQFSSVFEQTAKHFDLSPNDLHSWLRKAQEGGHWQLRGAYPQEARDLKDVNCILFDAYSSKMSPEIWGEDALMASLSPLIGPNCVFSTYAATGALKRTLKNLNFTLTPRRGFSGKRDSTYAVKGWSA